jgi:hypothetical protein
MLGDAFYDGFRSLLFGLGLDCVMCYYDGSFLRVADEDLSGMPPLV